MIEIELAAAGRHRRNPVICRTIKREGNKSSFTVNGKPSTRQLVFQLAQSFSIQIDNLCQFLPQDKVSEFAALSPVELLHSTQRAAAGPEMIEWHESLKKLRAEQKRLEANHGSDRELLSNLENRQEMQRADVERMRQRAEIQKRIELLEKSRPIPKYRETHEAFKSARQKKLDLERELGELKRQLEPALRAVNAKQDYCMKIDAVVKQKKQMVNRAETLATEVARKMSRIEDRMKDLNGQIEAEKKTATAQRDADRKIQQNINRLKRQIEEEPAAFDAAAYTERIVSISSLRCYEPKLIA
jgi:chromosome segregation ATPase